MVWNNCGMFGKVVNGCGCHTPHQRFTGATAKCLVAQEEENWPPNTSQLERLESSGGNSSNTAKIFWSLGEGDR